MESLMNWSMLAIALAGTLFNIVRRPEGFLLWMVSNLYWSVHNFHIEEYQQSILYLIYFGLAIAGYFSWKKEDEIF